MTWIDVLMCLMICCSAILAICDKMDGAILFVLYAILVLLIKMNSSKEKQ